MQAWPTLSEGVKILCVAELAQICKELSNIFGSGRAITGIDGGQIAERYFGSRSEWNWDLSLCLMQQNCTRAGLDTSELVFNPCDLTPGNVLIDFGLGIGTID